MLRFLREKGNSLILKGILGFVALTFISWGGFSLSRRSGLTGGQVAAWVNEEPISVQEFERRYAQSVAAVRRQLGGAYNEVLAQRLGLRRQTLSGIVLERLQIEEAAQLGMRISDEEVSQRIQEFPVFQRGGRFSRERYHQVLNANKLTPRAFEESQRLLLTIEQLRRYVEMGAAVVEQEVRDGYRWRNERIRIEAIRLPGFLFHEDVDKSGEKLKEYFEKNKETFRTRTERKAAWWYLPYSSVQAEVSFSEQELKGHYEKTQSIYTTKETVTASHILIKISTDADEKAVEKARATLLDIRKRVLGGADFAALAQKHSEGPSAPRGGDLGSFGRGAMVPEFEKAAFALKKGEVSEPVRSSFGLHLIHVRDRQEAGKSTFEAVREEIEKDLRKIKSREIANRKLRDLRYNIEDGKSLPAISGLKIGETGFFGKLSPSPLLPEDKLMASLIFQVKKKGELSREKEGEKGMMFIRFLDERKPRIPNFGEVKEKVLDAYQASAGSKIAAQKAGEWLKEIQEGRLSFKGLSERLKVKIINPEAFTRFDVPEEFGGSREIVEAAFRLKSGKVAQGRAGQDSFLLLGVEEPSVDMKKFADQKANIRRNLIAIKRKLLFFSYLEGLRQTATVRISENFAL